MGYFQTLTDAENCLEVVRRHYPNAFAPPAEFLPSIHSDAPSSPAPIEAETLSDTQVLRLLETRADAAVGGAVEDENCDEIAVLRPDDTGTRRALKEAVTRGAPVSFAVQLQWSLQPINLTGVPSLAIFKSHTLYATESHRDGRSRHFLRLGFFPSPIAAKQVAVQVLSTFGSAAVVPVVEAEVARAREAGRGTSAIPNLAGQRLDRGVNEQEAPHREFGRTEAVPQPPEPAAKRATFADADPLSESGVRHLRIEVQENSSGRWKIIRLAAAPANGGRV